LPKQEGLPILANNSNFSSVFSTTGAKKFIGKTGVLLTFELALLSLMIVSLPSLEAPKNIFLVFYVIVALIRQFKYKSLHSWGLWDWVFLSIISSSFLSTIFAGLAPASEWVGFMVLMTFITTGWLLSRSQYPKKYISFLFWLIILSTIPPLILGYWQYLFTHQKNALQLHSVGHVNHSAIYLAIIFGAAVGAMTAYWKSVSVKLKFFLILQVIILLIGLTIGHSRGAFGVSLILAALLMISSNLNGNLKKIFLLMLSLYFLSLNILNVEIIEKQKNNSAANDVLAGRAEVWNISIEAARLYPILGIGMSNWEHITPKLIQESLEKRHETYIKTNYNFVGHSHNLYLTALSERGIIGFMVLIGFMFFWMKEQFTSFKAIKKDALGFSLWAGSISAWFGTFGIGLVNTTFHHEHGILACLLLGLFLVFKKRV
jgi:O-antigen ligase